MSQSSRPQRDSNPRTRDENLASAVAESDGNSAKTSGTTPPGSHRQAKRNNGSSSERKGLTEQSAEQAQPSGSARIGRACRPKHQEIADANTDLLSRLGIDVSISTAACWACGISVKGSKPTRAHIKADCHGGTNDPRNFFLLCDHCHQEQPDGLPRGEQERWLLSAPSVWEWSGDIVNQMVAQVTRSATRLGVTAGEVQRWLCDVSKSGASDAISTGYRSAGGLQNGRANAIRNVVTLFEQWATKRGGPRQLTLFPTTSTNDTAKETA